jgi:hypothetical protein
MVELFWEGKAPIFFVEFRNPIAVLGFEDFFAKFGQKPNF